MAGRPRIYEEVDKEMKLKELVKTACDLFGPPYDDREPDMFTRKSIREVGRIMGLSQEKTRRLLIEGGWYSTQETRSVRKLMRQGLKDDEIAKKLDIPVKKVSSLKPYNGIKRKHSEVFLAGHTGGMNSLLAGLLNQIFHCNSNIGFRAVCRETIFRW